MENRRSYFRFEFASQERLGVEMLVSDSATTLCGTIVNLAIGGMAVCLADTGPACKVSAKCHLKFSLPTVRMTLPALLIHAPGQIQPHLGFQFLPHPDPTLLAAREKNLWCFLLNEQRRRRRAQLSVAG